MTHLLYCRIEVAPKSIPLSNTGDVPLFIANLLPVGAAVTIPPGVYQVFAQQVVPDQGISYPIPIANINYEPDNFVVTPEKEVKGAQFGVYVDLLNLNC